MQETSKLIAYFRDCYRADNSQQQLFDISGRKFEEVHFLDDPDLLNGHHAPIAVDQDWAERADYEYQLHQKEKSLYGCAIFVTGIAMVMGRETKIAAPLFFFPVRIRKIDGDYMCESTGEPAVINSSVLRLLLSSTDRSTTSLDDWFPYFSINAFDFGLCGRINTFLDEKYPAVSSEELLLFPNMVSEKELRKHKRAAKGFSVFPGVAIALVEKPKRSMGVLSELGELATSADYSTALEALLQKNPKKGSLLSSAIGSKETGEVLVPANLTDSQENTIRASREYPLSLIVGPPGTGKSYTIASLAVDAVAGDNRSVLIVAASDEALDVIQQKIVKDFGLKDVVMRAKKRNKGGSVVTKLRRIISGNIRRVNREMADKSLARINELKSTIQKLRELYWGHHVYEEDHHKYQAFSSKSLFGRARRWLSRRKLDKKELQWQTMSLIVRYTNDLNRELNSYLRIKTHLGWHQALEKNMSSVQQLYAALKSNRGVEREQLFENISADLLRSVFPIWLAKIDELSVALPFRKELFDVVVIDEATQCDIARALPAFQRAKSVVITGDPEQLRHLSFVSRGQMQVFQENNDLQNRSLEDIDFRKNSILDYVLSSVQSGEQVNFLDEHYRSHPAIIEFSNREFYGSNLKIMTNSPGNVQNKCIHHYQVEGSRSSKGENEREAQEVIKIIKKIIASEEKLQVKEKRTSIGVLSPLSDQVKFLSKALAAEIDLEDFKKHQILIGTPFHFQGEERDEMILSFCVCPDSHPSAFVHINKRDVFNVSITRARNHQHLVYSVNKTDLKQGSYLQQLLNSESQLVHVHDGETFSNYGEVLHAKAVVDIPIELIAVIKAHSVDSTIYTNYQLADVSVDILIENPNGLKMIDLIGFPGKYENPISLKKLRLLERLDVEIFPLSYHEWNLSKKFTEEALIEFLENGWG